MGSGLFGGVRRRGSGALPDLAAHHCTSTQRIVGFEHGTAQGQSWPEGIASPSSQSWFGGRLATQSGCVLPPRCRYRQEFAQAAGSDGSIVRPDMPPLARSCDLWTVFHCRQQASECRGHAPRYDRSSLIALSSRSGKLGGTGRVGYLERGTFEPGGDVSRETLRLAPRSCTARRICRTPASRETQNRPMSAQESTTRRNPSVRTEERTSTILCREPRPEPKAIDPSITAHGERPYKRTQPGPGDGRADPTEDPKQRPTCVGQGIETRGAPTPAQAQATSAGINSNR
jgi:hypothetical protein